MRKPDIIHLAETSSTNTYIKGIEDKADLADGTIFYTNFQTGGRGQRGNSWESEQGKNLLFSLIIHPFHIHPTEHFIISQTIAIAVAETLTKHVAEIAIKWPNDIYYQDKKIAGILIENELQDETIVNSVIGVGININQLEFHSNAPNPISLAQITDQNYDLIAILKEIQKNFLYLYANSIDPNNTIRDTYKDLLYRKKGYHTYRTPDGEIFDAKIKDIQKDGLLVLELEDKTIKKFAFKEISHVL